MKVGVLLILLVSGILSGCGTADPLGAPSAGSPAFTARPNNGEYLLGAGDKVKVTVFGEDKLSAEHLVDPNGYLNMPLAGAVIAAGQTTTQLTAELAKRLRGPYLRDPNVSIQVIETRPFYILGEVTKPGEYPYRPGMTIPGAVAVAGGYTFRANTRRVLITRPGATVETAVEAGPGVLIGPGDVLRVPESYF